MCARRDFLYKRAPHDALAARFNPLQLLTTTAPAATTSASAQQVADPKHSSADPITPTIPQTSETPTPTPVQVTTPSSTPAASPTPTSSDSPSPVKSSSVSTSASVTPATISSATSTFGVTTPTVVHGNSASTQVVVGSYTYSPTVSSPSPSATSSSGSGGVKTSTVIGGVAGTLAAIAVLGFLLMWCMRRQRNRDVDDFDAQAFKRQSVVLLDDPVDPPRSFNPRPPTMIEHHNASPALAAQTGFGGQNFYGNYGEYPQQPAYAPPEMIQPIGSPAPQPYGAPPMGYPINQPPAMGHPVYDPMQQPTSNPYLTRQPTSASAYAPPVAPPASLDPNARYIDLNRSSVSPYQAAQYADISRQLGTNDPNAHLPHESLDLPDDPLPSPFDSPAEHSAVPDSPTHAPPPAQAAVVPSVHVQAPGNATQPHRRPETVYEEDDAYGGI